MSFLMDFLPWAGWMLLAGVFMYAAGVVVCFNPDDPPLLCRLSDRVDQRHLLDHSLAEDKEVELLDSWFALDAREHPAA